MPIFDCPESESLKWPLGCCASQGCAEGATCSSLCPCLPVAAAGPSFASAGFVQLACLLAACHPGGGGKKAVGHDGPLLAAGAPCAAGGVLSWLLVPQQT